MADEMTIRKGTKIEPDELKDFDPAKRGVMIASVPSQEVEGQYGYWGYTQCPWCGNVGRSYLDTDFIQWYTCGWCGGSFQA